MHHDFVNLLILLAKLNQDSDDRKAGLYGVLEDNLEVMLRQHLLRQRARRNLTLDDERLLQWAVAIGSARIRRCAMYLSSQCNNGFLLGDARRQLANEPHHTEYQDELDNTASKEETTGWSGGMLVLFDLLCLARRDGVYRRLYGPRDAAWGWRGRFATILGVSQANIDRDYSAVVDELQKVFCDFDQNDLLSDPIVALVDQLVNNVSLANDCAERAGVVVAMWNQLNHAWAKGRIASPLFPALTAAFERTVTRLAAFVPQSLENAARELCLETTTPGSLMGSGAGSLALLELLRGLPPTRKTEQEPEIILRAIAALPLTSISDDAEGHVWPVNFESNWIAEVYPDRNQWPAHWHDARIALYWLMLALRTPGSASWAVLKGLLLETNHLPESKEISPYAFARCQHWLPVPDSIRHGTYNRAYFEAALAVLQRWQSYLTGYRPDCESSLVFLEIPKFFRDHLHELGHGIHLLQTWLDHPRQIPSAWENPVGTAQFAVMAALFHLTIEELSNDMALIYRASRNYRRINAKNAAHAPFLVHILGSTFDIPGTWRDPEVIRDRLNAIISGNPRIP